MGTVEKLSDRIYIVAIDEKDGTVFSQLAEQVKELIYQIDRPLVVADFEHVPRICSSLLGIILSLNQKLHDVGGDFALCNLNDQVLKVFQIIGVDSHIHLFQTRSDAVNALKKLYE